MFIQFRRFLLKKFCVQYLYRLILLISLAKNSIFCFFGAIRRQNSGQNRVPENAVKWGIPGKIKNAIFLLFAVKILVRQFEKPVNTGLGAYFPRNIYSTKMDVGNRVFRKAGKSVLYGRKSVGIQQGFRRIGIRMCLSGMKVRKVSFIPVQERWTQIAG